MSFEIIKNWELFAQADFVQFDRRFLLVFPALLLPFFFPAIFFKVFPTRRVLFLLTIPMLCSFALLVSEQVFVALVMLDAAIISLLAADFFLALPLFRMPFRVERQFDRIASLSRKHVIKLRIENKSKRAYALVVRDDIFPSLRAEPANFSERILPGRSVETLEYEIEPQERGLFYLKEVFFRVRSLLGFWHRYITLPCQNELCVYPNLRQINEYELLARSDRLHQLGVRAARRIGQDNDFERLRDYQLDDQYKFIDWSATAKRQKLTVRDFQATRSQRIMFLIDCGRMMTNLSENGLTLLDHSLNAALMLSYVALRRFDSVGMLCFSNQIINYIPPTSGERQMSRMLHGFFNLFPEPVESRYDEAFGYLSTRCRKRTLVILITNVADQINAKALQAHLTNLSGRHLPLGVFLRDHQIFNPVNHYINAVNELSQQATVDANIHYPKNKDYWRAGAAADILNWRHKVITDLRHQGTLTLDLFPEEMTAPLINKYLEIKARHLL